MDSCSNPVMEMEVESTPKPKWLELPRDITKNILARLGTIEIVTSACIVCPNWWNICNDPLMWCTIDMSDISQSHYDIAYSCRLGEICRYAVNRSCGHLKDIYISKFATDDLLEHIVNSASHLRCIRLEACYEISSEIFIEVLKKQPFLEELEISYCFGVGILSFESIGQRCPLLKSLKFTPCLEGKKECDDVALAIAKTMPKLHHLTILRNELTNDGLHAILDGCPLLESLDLRGCLYLDLDGSLGKRCSEQIKHLRFPTESIDHSFDTRDYFNNLKIKWFRSFGFDLPNYDIS